MSLCKQNYQPETEQLINRQITRELQASHEYLSIAAYFGRDSVALPGFARFFSESAKEEREHAEKLIEYQLLRGGQVVLGDITKPEVEWKSARNALEHALQMEKTINQHLLDLHAHASSCTPTPDPHLSDFLEGHFLGEQVEGQKELADMLTQLGRCGNDGLGLYLFDQQLLSKKK